MKKKHIDGRVLRLPSVIGFLIFYLLPFFGSLYYAFTENAFTKRFVGFENFKEILKNEYFLLAIKNTIIFTAVSVPLVMVMSVCIALLCVRYFPESTIIKGAFFQSFLLPSAVIVTLADKYLSFMPPFPALLIIFLWKYSGLCIMIIITALSGMDKQSLEAAKIDGAGVIKQVVFITLPSIKPTLFFALIISIVNSLKIYRESYLLYGLHPDMSVYMLQNFFANHFEKLNYQKISTAAIIFSVVLYMIVAYLYRRERKESAEIW